MLKEKSGKNRLPSTETSKEVTLDAQHQQFVDNVVDKCATLEAKRAEREFALLNLTEWRQVIHETAQGGGAGGSSAGPENKGSYNTANKVIQRLEREHRRDSVRVLQLVGQARRLHGATHPSAYHVIVHNIVCVKICSYLSNGRPLLVSFL
jgi:hypothetical protein